MGQGQLAVPLVTNRLPLPDGHRAHAQPSGRRPSSPHPTPWEEWLRGRGDRTPTSCLSHVLPILGAPELSSLSTLCHPPQECTVPACVAELHPSGSPGAQVRAVCGSLKEAPWKLAVRGEVIGEGPRQEEPPEAGGLSRQPPGSLGRGDSCGSRWQQRAPCLSGMLWKCCVCAHEYVYSAHVHSPRPGPNPGALPVCVRARACVHMKGDAHACPGTSLCVCVCVSVSCVLTNYVHV